MVAIPGGTFTMGNDKTEPDEAPAHKVTLSPLSQSAVQRDPDSGGTVAVGSYPLGASRDGILDMAGNVAQWCSDYYHPYAPEAQTDPCNQEPSNYRVIRGGSFGYYAHSQRATDREFNSPVYPGHIYYGLRVALPGSGLAR
jgi:formylglycine-generating enzyme required for sulfatase activity